MQIKKLYPFTTYTNNTPFQRVEIKVIFLLLIVFTSFSACLYKKMTFVESEAKRCVSHKEGTTSNPLKVFLSYLRLTERDLKVELAKTKKDYFLLEKVTIFLNKPLNIEPYADYLSRSIRDNKVSLEKVLSLAIKELEIDINSKTIQDVSSRNDNEQFKNTLPMISNDARVELLRFLSIAYSAHTRFNEAFSLLSHSEIGFLKNYFSEMILNDKTELAEGAQVPPPSSSRRERQYVKETSFHLASKIKRKEFYEASLLVALALDHLLKKVDLLKKITVKDKSKGDIGVSGDIILWEDTPLGKIIIGGKGPTFYRNTKALLIIDLGGDDEYHNISSFFNFNPFISSLSIIVDLEGNDLYISSKKYSQGGGSFGLNFLVDCSGDDRYLSYDFSQGCGFFGVGILYDKEGDDSYLSDIMGQGAAAFGIGILCDLTGNDSYHGNLFNQGMGFVGGIGLLIEAQGNDSFFSGGKYPDFREPEVAFDSFSQGFGFGCRNFGAGGIGILWDDEGNDHYSSSYFSQGSSYWLAMGLLIDNGGSDSYHARRYTQGTGTHLTVGALIDRSGDDCYTAWGVAQGCAHDFSQGLLFDSEGDDTYSAKWFAQGASGSSGVGMLIDQKGNDSYLCGTFNSQGSGNYDLKRESGSIGLLIDLQGEDSYTGKGEDNCFWRQGKYGGGIDYSKSLWNKNTFSWSADELPLSKGKISSPIKPPVLKKKELLPALEANLGNENSKQLVIKQLSEEGSSIIPHLIDYLDIKDDLLKLTIMEFVEKIGKGAGPILRKKLEDSTLDNSIKYYILFMLGDIEDEQSQNTLTSLLKDNDPKLRALAMRALSKLETTLPLVEILPYAEDENPSVRKYLAIALKDHEEPAALKVLTKLLADSHFNVRFAAFESLRNKGLKAKQFLLELINHLDGCPGYTRNLARDLLEEYEIENW
jgi:hypothetical protein